MMADMLYLGHQTVGTGTYTHDQLRLWLKELIDSPVWGSSRLADADDANVTVTAIAANAVTYAAANAADAVNAYVNARIWHARHAIDAWHRICGTSPSPISEETTACAIRQMQAF